MVSLCRLLPASSHRFEIDSQIEDPCFVRSFKARALLDAVAARAAVADALIASDEPSIVELRHKERAEGRRQELVVGFEAMCEVLDIALTQAQREQLAKSELDELITIRQALRMTKQWPSWLRPQPHRGLPYTRTPRHRGVGCGFYPYVLQRRFVASSW